MTASDWANWLSTDPMGRATAIAILAAVALIAIWPSRGTADAVEARTVSGCAVLFSAILILAVLGAAFGLILFNIL